LGRKGVFTDDAIEKIMDALTERERLTYLEVAGLLGVAPSTASKICTMFAQRYPKNVEYYRGLLRLLSPFTPEDFSERRKREFFQRLAEEKTKEAEELRHKLEKWKHNHWKHIKEFLMKGDVKGALRYMERIEKEAED